MNAADMDSVQEVWPFRLGQQKYATSTLAARPMRGEEAVIRIAARLASAS